MRIVSKVLDLVERINLINLSLNFEDTTFLSICLTPINSEREHCQQMCNHIIFILHRMY